jgi:hypothetical protein
MWTMLVFITHVSGSAALTTIEFDTLSRCETAVQAVTTFVGHPHGRRAMCIQVAK